MEGTGAVGRPRWLSSSAWLLVAVFVLGAVAAAQAWVLIGRGASGAGGIRDGLGWAVLGALPGLAVVGLAGVGGMAGLAGRRWGLWAYGAVGVPVGLVYAIFVLPFDAWGREVSTSGLLLTHVVVVFLVAALTVGGGVYEFGPWTADEREEGPRPAVVAGALAFLVGEQAGIGLALLLLPMFFS